MLAPDNGEGMPIPPEGRAWLGGGHGMVAVAGTAVAIGIGSGLSSR